MESRSGEKTKKRQTKKNREQRDGKDTTKEKNEMEANGSPSKGLHAVEGAVPPQHIYTVR